MNDIKLAIYGGAFNPPHPGHASVIKSLINKADHILVVPSFAHPFGKKMMPFEIRASWLEKIIFGIGHESIKVDLIERELATIKTPIFSIDLLRYISEKYNVNKKEIALVMGEDNAAVFPTFYGYSDIIKEFSTITVEETIPLHSSMIRAALLENDEVPQEWIPAGMEQSDYSIFKSGEYA